jgi:hypothetical protein
MKHLRVLGVTEDAWFVTGGRLAFLDLMKALKVAENSVTLIKSSGISSSIIRLNDVPVHVIRVPKVRILGPLLFVLRLFFTIPAYMTASDVVVVNSGYPLLLIVFFAKLFRKKVAVLQHDVLSMDYLQKVAATPSRRITAVLRWVLLYPPLVLSDGVLSISGDTARRLRRTGYRKRIWVVGNVVK